MLTVFHAFADDSQSVMMGDLTLENQGEQVNLYGSATFYVNRDSLQLAKQLQQVINDIINYLEAHEADKVAGKTSDQILAENTETVANPFL